MRGWLKSYKDFWKNKYYVLLLSLTAVFSYGYLITHHTIGIDDTPSIAYFEEGLAAIVGRWVIFLLNKIVPVASIAPFLIDLIGVLLFMAAVTVWAVLLERIFGELMPKAGYFLFACLFLSNPLISEVYTYYLHNGISIGYLFSGISLCCFLSAVSEKKKSAWAGSVLSLVVAVGCYESFMIVYIMGVLLVLCSLRIAGREKKGVFLPLCGAAAVTVVSVLLRSLIVSGCIAIFGLESLSDQAVRRSVSEMLGWMMAPGAFSELGMILKRVIVMYGIFGYAYLPIRYYVIAVLCAAVCTVVYGIRRRDFRIPVLFLGGLIASYLLIFIEGKATLYRSAQFLPVFSAWGFFLTLLALRRLSAVIREIPLKISGKGKAKEADSASAEAEPSAKISKKGKGLWSGNWLWAAGCLLTGIFLLNQCVDMNHWFYVDDRKYEDAKNTAQMVAYELEKSYDTSKPVLFTGTYLVPESIIGDAYVKYGSDTYYKMLRLTELLDEHLLEKFQREYGVWVAQTPSLSVIEWGRTAFDTEEELIAFFAMHGYELKAYAGKTPNLEAEKEAVSLPHFPAEGSIVDKGDYILVHF